METKNTISLSLPLSFIAQFSLGLNIGSQLLTNSPSWYNYIQILVGRWQRQLEGIGENGGHWQNLRHRFRGHSLADPDELCDPVI
ncbi:hypothetical protein CMV_027280 [Castanea mollissima]|uniref:Uncharacterized protein n=1 Tax=Castanea mollissima TaxID=60419 RepID=A0A8J4QID1_9ROSI|nr:hypothetical protein CMV_027280 [Castanea mollissima]